MTETPDTSPEAVERLCSVVLTEIAMSKGLPVSDDDVAGAIETAATLRALAAERDRALEWRDHDRERALAAEARAEAAEAEVALLREALECANALICTPIARRKLSLAADDERVMMIRSALQEKPHD